MANLSKRQILAGLGLSGFAPLLQACDAPKAADITAPKKIRTQRVARDIPYGEGPRRKYDVYAPVDLAAPAPVVVYLYGGGWAEGDKESNDWAGRALAGLGYVAVLPDYRLVPEVRYPDFLVDCAAAVQHVIAHASEYGGDGSRLELMGHSAGAYNAVMIALDPVYFGLKPDAPSPIKAVIGVGGPYDFYPFKYERVDAFGQWPKPEETQPIFIARKLSTKFLFIYSQGDMAIGAHEALSLETKLKAAGTDARSIGYVKPSHTDIILALAPEYRGLAPTLSDTRVFLAEAL
jgi:acetyl esterase/lipase